MRSTRPLPFVVLIAALAAAAAGAQSISKLPADKALPQTGDSPGKVVFSHQTHTAVQPKADCTACHPKLAPMSVRKGQAKREAVTHAKMEKGQACGACHNGKAAHGLDDCATCHK